jgi:hypothetical protein
LRFTAMSGMFVPALTPWFVSGSLIPIDSKVLARIGPDQFAPRSVDRISATFLRLPFPKSVN